MYWMLVVSLKCGHVLKLGHQGQIPRFSVTGEIAADFGTQEPWNVPHLAFDGFFSDRKHYFFGQASIVFETPQCNVFNQDRLSF